MRLEDEIDKLRKWDDAYYNGTPVVTDQVYDTERDRILSRIKLESPQHPYLQQVGSPTSGGVWPKFKHESVMGSLFKVNNKEDFLKWAEKKSNNLIITEKADGCTVAAYYKNGTLTNLTTRGDGETGEDITGNAKYFQDIKYSIPGFTGILRGEAIILLDIFEKHLAPLGLANPRNAVSGKVRDTQNPDLKRHVSIRWFDIITNEHLLDDGLPANLQSWEKKFALIKSFGLPTLPFTAGITAEKAWDIYQNYTTNLRATLNYWIDGLVVRVNNCYEHDVLGIVDKRPKGAIAIKFPAVGVETKLISFEINRGLSGRLTPVGIIEPIEIDGTTVSRVNMHGPDWIHEMGIAVGDTVEVAKAGDIIPQITQKISNGKNRQEIKFPTQCPVCQASLVRNGAYIECQNKDCEGEVFGSIAKWLQKLDIKGIGDSILRELIKEIKDVAQLYQAEVSTLVKATGGSQKLGKKLWKELHSKKEIPLAVFLSALHIPSLGSTNGQRLASHFKTLDAVLVATEKDIKNIQGIAENASKIINGLRQKHDLIKRLRSLIDIQEIQQGIFTGISFCITGKCSKPRNEIEEWIKNLGGVVKGVDKGLTYLVTDDPNSGSAKNQKADKYGVKKISEQDLYHLAKGNHQQELKEDPIKVNVRLEPINSLFESDKVDSGWLELQRISQKKYKILKTSFKSGTQKMGYIGWSDDVENLDSELNGVSHCLKWKNVKLTDEDITGDSLSEIEDALKLVKVIIRE